MFTVVIQYTISISTICRCSVCVVIVVPSYSVYLCYPFSVHTCLPPQVKSPCFELSCNLLRMSLPPSVQYHCKYLMSSVVKEKEDFHKHAVSVCVCVHAACNRQPLCCSWRAFLYAAICNCVQMYCRYADVRIVCSCVQMYGDVQ